MLTSYDLNCFGGGLGNTRRIVSDGEAEDTLLVSLVETDRNDGVSCSSEMEYGRDDDDGEEVMNEDLNGAQRDLGTWRLETGRSPGGEEEIGGGTASTKAKARGE